MSHLIHTEYLLSWALVPGPPRRPARLDVRCDRHRQPGRECVPTDQAVRVARPRLLRSRAGSGRARCRGRTDARRADRAAHSRCRRRRRPADNRGCDPGARLRPSIRGGRDARQGGRDPRGIRARAGRIRRTRPAWPRSPTDPVGSCGAGQPQRPAEQVLARRPSRHRAVTGLGRSPGRRARRGGRLRRHASSHAARVGHVEYGGEPP